MDFLNKYIIEPIYTDAPYNFVNTILYALIAIAALFGIYKILQKLKINVDIRFFYALLPFIVLGSSIRAFVDHNILGYKFWFVSPGIYLLVAGLFLGVFFLSHVLEKHTKVTFWKRVFTSGVSLNVIVWAYALAHGLRFENFKFGLAILGLAALSSAIIYVVFKKLKIRNKVSFLPFPAHMLDASATFIAVDFLGAVEKHPLPTIINNLAGTAAIMYALKLIVLIPLVYLLNKEVKDKNLANYFLIAVAVLGFAQGLRDLLTILIV